MDPDQSQDDSGHAHVLLLHIWSDDPGRARLLVERLEETAGGRLRSLLPVFRLQLVSGDFQMDAYLLYDWADGSDFVCSLIGQVVLGVSSLAGPETPI